MRYSKFTPNSNNSIVLYMNTFWRVQYTFYVISFCFKKFESSRSFALRTRPSQKFVLLSIESVLSMGFFFFFTALLYYNSPFDRFPVYDKIFRFVGATFETAAVSLASDR